MMSVKLVEAEVQVDVERLDSDAIDSHLRTSTSVLQQILQQDQESETAVDKDGHPCPDCGKLYKTSSTLHTHALLKHPENNVEVRCTSCDKRYASPLSLHKHMQYMHRYSHRCNACYRTFETIALLTAHGATCAKSERPCGHCGKFYDSKLSLRNHVKYMHPEEKKYWYDVCHRAFHSSRGLANHTAALHPDGMSCTRCDKKFNSMPSLQSHFLYKHSENGARCNMCRKVFASERSLSRHVSKNHSNVLVYEERSK